MSFTWRMSQAFCSLSCHEYLCRLPGGCHRLALCLPVSICIVYLDDITDFLLFVLPRVSVSFTWRTSQTCSLFCREYLCHLPGGCHRLALCLAVIIHVIY